jgi:hypothetical protein
MKEIIMKNFLKFFVTFMLPVFLLFLIGAAIRQSGYPVVGFIIRAIGTYWLLAGFFNLPSPIIKRKRRK